MTDGWNLRIHEPGRPQRELEAVDGLTIGRHPDNALTLSEGTASSHHAQIVAKDGHLAVRDLGSSNGTLVDGSRLLREGEQARLHAGMIIKLGLVEIFVTGPPATQTWIPADSDRTVGAAGAQGEQPSGTAASPSSPGSATIAPGANPSRGGRTAGRPLAEELPRPPATTPQGHIGPAWKPTWKLSGSGPPPPHVSPARPAAAPPSALGIDSDPLLAGLGSDALDSIITLAAQGNDFGARAKLARLGARLVIAAEAERRVVPLREIGTLIGRAPSADLKLENRSVSSEQARIVYSPRHNLFLIEDLESANGTQVQASPLLPNAPRELRSDQHLRFGSVEAVFLQDLDEQGQELPADRHQHAIALLRSRGLLERRAERRAREQATRDGTGLAEALLLGGHVRARDWCKAVEDARVALDLIGLRRGRGGSVWRWIVLSIVLALGASLLHPAARAFVHGLLAD